MVQRSAIVVALLAAALGCAATAQAQGFPGDLNDQTVAVDELVWPEEPRPSPKFYESPYGRTYFVADGLAFARDGNDDFPVAGLGGFGVLSPEDIDFAHQPGLRALAGLRVNNFTAIEASWLGFLDWDDSAVVRNATINDVGTPGDLDSPLSGFGNPAQIVGLDYNREIRERIITKLNSYELNLRRRLPMPYCTTQVTGLVGLRYMQIKDEFQFRSQSFLPLFGGVANAVDVRAMNEMFGVQLGGSLELHVERRAWLNFEAKGLMLFNDADQATTYTIGPIGGGGTTTFGGSNDSQVSFGVELQGTLLWRFHPNIVGRLGYQAIFLEGLALGSENFSLNAPTIPAGDFSGFHQSGDLIFHGPFTGMTFTW
jgi:hypothetical protein